VAQAHFLKLPVRGLTLKVLAISLRACRREIGIMSGGLPKRQAYHSGADKPLMRGVFHATVALTAPFVMWELDSSPRTQSMIVSTWIGYLFSACLHCVPWTSPESERVALALDFLGISCATAGHIICWEATAFSAISFAAAMNSASLGVGLALGIAQGADMLVFLRGRWGLALALQFLLLTISEIRGMQRLSSLVCVLIGLPMALMYFRRYGAFDAKCKGPLPLAPGIWSPHEWYHLLFAAVHCLQLFEIKYVESAGDQGWQ